MLLLSLSVLFVLFFDPMCYTLQLLSATVQKSTVLFDPTRNLGECFTSHISDDVARLKMNIVIFHLSHKKSVHCSVCPKYDTAFFLLCLKTGFAVEMSE